MDLRAVNKICFTVSIVCIMVSVVIGLSMIWTPGINETMWRLLGTVGIVFLGSSATLSVSTAFGGKSAEPPRNLGSKPNRQDSGPGDAKNPRRHSGRPVE